MAAHTDNPHIQASTKLTRGLYSVTVSSDGIHLQHFQAWRTDDGWAWGESVADYTPLGLAPTLKAAKKRIFDHAMFG